MNNRITQRDLELVLNRINHAAGENPEPYTRDDNGKHHANVGTYVIDGAYGGWKLQRLVNEQGGVTNITTGYVPKRELYHQMHAFLAGLDAC